MMNKWKEITSSGHWQQIQLSFTGGGGGGINILNNGRFIPKTEVWSKVISEVTGSAQSEAGAEQQGREEELNQAQNL